VEIESITHKALRKMFTTGVNKGVIEHRRVINMLQYIVDAGSFDELAIPLISASTRLAVSGRVLSP
jgi:proteic killer suppression protein